MEAEEEDSQQVRQDVPHIYIELAEAQAREMQQIQQEETRRREEYIRNINAMNEWFEQQKKQKEEEQKAMEEERKHELQNKLELEQRLQTLERQGQHHEAQILSSDLNVLHLMQADNEQQCQARNQEINNAYSANRDKWKQDVDRERQLLEEWLQYFHEKRLRCEERRSEFVSQGIVDLQMRSNRGEQLTTQEQEYLCNAGGNLPERVEEVMQAPTLQDREIRRTRVEKPKGPHPLVNVAEKLVMESGGLAPPKKASAPSATATSSQQHQVSSQPTHTPAGKKPTQAKAVEAEKQKHPQQQQQFTEGIVANKGTDDNLPDRLSVRKRKPAATKHIDSDNEEVSPQTMKFVKSMTKIFKKEKTATPSMILEDIQICAIGDLLLDAARNNTVARHSPEGQGTVHRQRRNCRYCEVNGQILLETQRETPCSRHWTPYLLQRSLKCQITSHQWI